MSTLTVPPSPNAAITSVSDDHRHCAARAVHLSDDAELLFGDPLFGDPDCSDSIERRASYTYNETRSGVCDLDAPAAPSFAKSRVMFPIYCGRPRWVIPCSLTLVVLIVLGVALSNFGTHEEPIAGDDDQALDAQDKSDSDPPPPGASVSIGSAQFWHAHPVSWASFAPDGKTLATMDNHELVLWDVPSGKESRRIALPGYESWIDCVAASPDFQILATARYDDDTVRLWELRTGKLLRTLPGYLVRFSPDNKRLLTVDRAPKRSLRLWTVADGRQEWTQELSTLMCVGFSADDNRLVVAGYDQTFDPADKKLIIGDLTIRSFDLGSGEQRLLQRIREPKIAAIAAGHTTARFSADGSLLAVGGGAGVRAAWLFEVQTGKRLFEFGKRHERRGHWDMMAIIGFLPDGKTLVTGDDGGHIDLRDTATGEEVSSFLAGSTQGVVSPDGKSLAVFNGRRIDLRELPSGKLLIKPRLRTYLRPVVARLAATDPFRVALHWAGPEGPEGHGSGTYHMNRGGKIQFCAPFDGEYSKVETLKSLTFHVTTPDGMQHELHAEIEGKDQKMPPWYRALAEHPSFFFTLDEQGFNIDDRSGKFTGKWAGKAAPSFDVPGVYQVAISGNLVLKPNPPIPFQSAPVKLERAVEGFVPLEQIRTLALTHVKKLLPMLDRGKIKDDDSHGNHKSPISIVDGAKDVRIVLLVVEKPNENIMGSKHIDHYQVRLLPDGRVVQVSTYSATTCVGAGTTIATETGLRPIEDVTIGDRVWGYDLERGQPVTTTVRAVRRGLTAKVLRFGNLRVTADHPILAAGTWKSAGDVRASDPLLAQDGTFVVAGHAEICEAATPVYDLCVDEPHNFFAGGILVHNKSVGYDIGYFDTWNVFTATRRPYENVLINK